jgi:hypothetical protein
MPLTITAAQRDVLYDDILGCLSGIGDIELAVDQGDYVTARRLATAFSDDLRLMSEDLGWDENGFGEMLELRTPPDVLRRALGRIRDVALGLDASEEEERVELRENAERNQLIVDTCSSVLSSLAPS